MRCGIITMEDYAMKKRQSARCGNSFQVNLRDIRLVLGWSQNQLAMRAGVDPGAISHWEAGRREPSYKTLTLLCQALGVTPNRLMEGDY
jgi:transcriptional regulator with XRE-family HTH domain